MLQNSQICTLWERVNALNDYQRSALLAEVWGHMEANPEDGFFDSVEKLLPKIIQQTSGLKADQNLAAQLGIPAALPKTCGVCGSDALQTQLRCKNCGRIDTSPTGGQ